MKEIKVFALEGCGNCKKLISTIEENCKGVEFNLVKKFCGAEDSACDALEDKLNTARYPIVMLTGFSYFKEKYNKSTGIVYICNNYSDTLTPVAFDTDIVGEAVLGHNNLFDKVIEIINRK